MTGIILFFVICFVAGVLSLLYGKKMVNFLLAIYAFCGVYRFVLDHFPNQNYVVWIAIGAGIVAILLVKFAKKLAFFLLGALVGFTLGMTIANFLPDGSELLYWCVVIGSAVLLGFITSHNSTVLIRYATAYIGGEMISSATLLLVFGSSVIPTFTSDNISTTVTALGQYYNNVFMTQYTLWVVIGAIVLMFFGATFQKKH